MRVSLTSPLSTLGCTPQMPQQPRLGQATSRSQELHQGLPCCGQVLKYLSHHLLSPSTFEQKAGQVAQLQCGMWAPNTED